MYETKERFAKILGRLESKISDIQVTLDDRDVVKRNDEEDHQKKSSKRKSEKELKKEIMEEILAAQKEDGFRYSFLLKYFITFSFGALVGIVYQRLSKLDEIIKHI